MDPETPAHGYTGTQTPPHPHPFLSHMLPPTLPGPLTWDQAPVRHWAGQGTRRHGLLASGRLPRQALAGMALRVPLERGSRHCTPRVCSPSFPQLRLQALHSSVTHLETDRTKAEGGGTIRTLLLGAASHQRRHVLQNAAACLVGLWESLLLSPWVRERYLFKPWPLSCPWAAVNSSKPQFPHLFIRIALVLHKEFRATR